MNQFSKWLRLAGLLLFALAIGLYLLLLVRGHTYDQVGHPELSGKRRVVDTADNGFAVLLAATNQLHWEEFSKSDYRNFQEAMLGTNWNPALAREVLATNQAALAAWDKARLLPEFQVPTHDMADNLAYLSSWKNFACLAIVRERSRLDEHQASAGLDGLCDVVQAGLQMNDADGVIIHYLVGTAVKTMALNTIRLSANTADVNKDALKKTVARLGRLAATDLTGWTNSIRSEYEMQMQFLCDLKDGKVTNSDLPNGTMMKLSGSLPVFSLNKSQALFADAAATLIQDGAAPYSQLRISKFQDRPSIGSMLMSGNVVGEVLFYMMQPATLSMLAKQKQSSCALQATRVILALRAFQLKHGTLPETLNALVPEFLDKVPADDFNGQPLHYSASKKIVYSVGKNLKDDGGDDRGNDEKVVAARHLDFAFHFDF
jgi:hypothetical protein